MKKQFNYLLMVVAVIVLAATGAKAQDGLTVATAMWHLANSTEDVSVTNHADFTYDWAITAAACDGTAGGPAVGASIGTGSNSVTITYTADATGVYRITCTENDPEGCSTIRQFYTAIMTIDVVVIASDGTGTVGGNAPASLSSCNDWVLTQGSALVPNTLNGGASLVGFRDDAYYNTRWVNVTLTSASGAGLCTVNNMPDVSTMPWTFDYEITGTLFSSADNFIQMDASIPAGATYTDNTSDNSDISVAVGTLSFDIPLRSNIQWGTTSTDADQSFVFTVSNVQVDGNGGEGTASLANNASASQTIYASPATTVITNP